MDAAISASVISALSGLLGAGVGGAVTTRAQKKAREGEREDAFARAFAATNTALDLLMLELRALPRPTGFARAANGMLSEQRFPNLVSLLNWVGAMTVFRSTRLAVARFSEKTQELAVLADVEVLEALEQLASLLSAIDVHDEEWQRRWEDGRRELVVAGRSQFGRNIAQATDSSV